MTIKNTTVIDMTEIHYEFHLKHRLQNYESFKNILLTSFEIIEHYRIKLLKIHNCN